MEMRAVVLAGALAAFVAGALSMMVWHPLCVAISKHSGTDMWRPQDLKSLLGSLLLQVCAGTVLGFLFWLSWGLTGIVDVLWWQRGLIFAALTWLGLCLPMLLSQALASKLAANVLAKSALESLTSCTLIGLACARSWGP
jgi:hypothetical protein